MAQLICEFEGSRGRYLKLYDTKCVILTKITIGSVITGNATDGEKTIFLTDISGVQFKKSGLAIGYLQFETPSMQMNNKNSNFFSENTFTFEEGRNGITNDLMECVYNYIVDRLEEIKFGKVIINEIPDFEAMKEYKSITSSTQIKGSEEFVEEENETIEQSGEECQLCGGYFDHLTYCEIKDSFGTKYRCICDECITKYNAKPKN